MEIRAFDFSDSDYEAITDIHNAVYPSMLRVVQDAKDADARRKPKYLSGRYLAFVDGQPVGEAWYEQPHASYREGKFLLRVQVKPEHRQQSVGTALYDVMMARLTELNGSYFYVETLETETAGIQFGEKRGYKYAMRYPVSHLDPRVFDTAAFAKQAERFDAAGYTVHALAELRETDPDWARKLHFAINTIAEDVPSPEPHVWSSFDEWIERFNSYKTIIPDAYFVALDGDQYVGISFLLKNLARPEMLEQALTGTLRDYRRKGIATVLKVRGIAWAQAQGYALIETANEENNPMYDLNQRLGFVTQPADVEYVLDLAKNQA